MWALIRNWLSPPTFPEDRDKTRLARILNTLLLLVTGSSAFVTIMNVVLGEIESAVVLLVLFVVFLGQLGLVRAGYLQFTSWFAPFVLLVLATYIFSFEQGVKAIGILTYPLILVLSSLLLGRFGAFFFAGLSTLAIGFLVYGEATNLITPRPGVLEFSTVINAAVMLVVTAVILYFLMNDLVQSLEQTRQQEKQLQQANQELEAIRDSLEDQVLARTRTTDIARQQAEDAQQATEELMWLLAGQTQLYDQMRGELDINALSNRIVHHMCQFLELPIGTLFVSQADDRLVLAGSFAFQQTAAHPVEWVVGQGVLGAAARKKQVMIVDDLPDDYLYAQSSIGSVVIKHLLLLPFVYQDQLFGILELGSSRPFTSKQLDFLQNTAEGIALALQTAQSVAKVNELQEVMN